MAERTEGRDSTGLPLKVGDRVRYSGRTFAVVGFAPRQWTVMVADSKGREHLLWERSVDLVRGGQHEGGWS